MSRLAMLLILLETIGCADPPRAIVVGGDDLGATPETGPPPTAMTAALAAAGLDVAQLPRFDDLGQGQLPVVMDTFARALGIGCGDCHAADFTVATPRTRIARKMWDQLVRGLVRRDGGALYCDSCHAGHPTFLDRDDPTSDGALGQWMRTNYVTPLARRDGATHDCTTCHGSPFVGGFLDDWGAADGAPDAGAPPDLGARPVDFGVVGCESLLACLDGCASDDNPCLGACKRRASAAAKALLTAAETCADAACIVAGRCHSAADDSGDCNVCFSNASAGGATGIACLPADDPICGACAAAWLECETK